MQCLEGIQVARLPDKFNFGDRSDISPEKVYTLLERMYTDIATAVNSKPDLYQRNVNGVPTDGNTADTFLAQGSININTTTNKVEMLTNHVDTTTVIWTTLS